GTRRVPATMSTGPERADERAAAVPVAPRLVEPLAGEAVLGRHRGLRRDAPGQGLVEGRLVAARLVVVGVDAPGGDPHVAGPQGGAAVAVALADQQVDPRGPDRDHLADQPAGLRL